MYFFSQFGHIMLMVGIQINFVHKCFYIRSGENMENREIKVEMEGWNEKE